MCPRRLHKHGSQAFFKPLRFGGWGDYQEWVDHDFLPCPGFTGQDIENEDATSEPAPGTPSVDATSPDVQDDPVSEQEQQPAATVNALAAEPVATDLGTVEFQYETELVVRPYVRTGGRAAPSHDLRLETLLRSVLSWRRLPQAHRLPDNSEIRKICALCEVTLSLAELSAYLRAPLGVVRVLVDDAVKLGLVSILLNEPSAVCPSMDLLRRVHEGLLALN
jgi:hypothetical protein